MSHMRQRASELRLSSVAVVSVVAMAALGAARLPSGGAPSPVDLLGSLAAAATPFVAGAVPPTSTLARTLPTSSERAARDLRPRSVEPFESSNYSDSPAEPVVEEDANREPTSRGVELPGSNAASPPAVEPVRVVLWGDSLAAEATASFHEVFSHQSGVTATEVVWPGVAPCDAMPSIAAMSAERTVDVAVVEFSGNAYTDCMIDAATGQGLVGDALIARYESDVTVAIELLGGAGATVLLAGAPPVDPDGQWVDRARVADLYRDVAARYDHVRFVDAGAVLSLNGEFTYTLPCLDFEGDNQGCVNGQIQVRNDDGLHIGLGDPDVWSSGSYRYGTALAEAAEAATTR